MFKTFLTVFSLPGQAIMSTRPPTDHYTGSHYRTSDTVVRSKLLASFKTIYFVWFYDSISKLSIIFQRNSQSKITYDTAVTFLDKLHLTTVSEFFIPLVYKCVIKFYTLYTVISDLYNFGLDIQKLHQEVS